MDASTSPTVYEVMLGVEDDYPVFRLTEALFVMELGQVYLAATKLSTPVEY